MEAEFGVTDSYRPILIMIGYFSVTTGRSPMLMKDPFYVYDITIMEWDNLIMMQYESKVYLMKNEKFNVYQVICKRDLCYIMVLFTGDYDQALELFERCKVVINILEKEIPWFQKTQTVNIYKKIMEAMKMNHRWSATHIAAWIGLTDFISKANIEVSNDINKQFTPDKMTPIHLAIKSGDLNTVKAVLHYSPDLDIQDSNGLCSLHHAAVSSAEVLSFVIALPGMLERNRKKTTKGCTPIHLACYMNKIENVRVFLTVGLTVSMLTVVPPTEEGYRKAMMPSANNDVIVNFIRRNCEEMDDDLVQLGGTPLHWNHNPLFLKKLIDIGFDINAQNLKGDTPLIAKVKKNHYKCVLTLLYHGANVDVQNKKGNTALFYAVRSGDIDLTQALVVFDAKLDIMNRRLQTARHIAAAGNPDGNYPFVLYILSAVGARRCSIEIGGCNPGCAFNGRFDGKRYLKWPIFNKLDRFYKSSEMKTTVANHLADAGKAPKSNLVNMLSLDGYGMQSLVTLQLIHELQRRLQFNLVEYFDWFSATSTTSLIAAGLLTGKSTADIRLMYFRFKEQIFENKPVDKPFDTDLMASFMQSQFGLETRLADLFQNQNKFFIIPTTILDQVPVHSALFRSYPSSEPDPEFKVEVPLPAYYPSPETPIWEAVQVSCTIPFHFNVNLPTVDGALTCNSAMEMLTEFRHYQQRLRESNQMNSLQNVNMLLSFGGGTGISKPFLLPDLHHMFSWNILQLSEYTKRLNDMFALIHNSLYNTDSAIVEK